MSQDIVNKKNEHIVDFNEVRAQKLEEKRRKTERIFFQNLLNVYCVTGNSEIRQIELVDVSDEGCSFQVPHDSNHPWPTTDELLIRLYFSQDTYLPINLKIQNSRACIEKGKRYTRYGCLVDKTLTSYQTYMQFVRFLKLYAEHAHKDKGDVTVFYL
mgnify:CR=1 FL=1